MKKILVNLNDSPNFLNSQFVDLEVFFRELEKAGFVRLVPNEYFQTWEATGNTRFRKITGPLGTQSKSDSHPGRTETSLPNKSGQEDSAPVLAFPKTPQEIYNLLSYLDIGYLGKAVDQWLIEGSVTNSQYQYLSGHLLSLAQVYGKFRRELFEILKNGRDPANEQSVG